MLPVIKQQLIDLMQQALANIAKNRGIDPNTLAIPHLERPKVAEHGDVATNIAMQLAKGWKTNPRELAQAFVDELKNQSGFVELLASVEIAGPGFINLRLTQAAKSKVIDQIFAEKSCFGQQPEIGKKY